MKPDILILMMEEQMKQVKPEFPVITGLMAQMIFVPDCFSVSPLREAAFQCFLTGRYPKVLEDPLKSDRTWVMDFAEEGYKTVFFDSNTHYSDGNSAYNDSEVMQPRLWIAQTREWDRELDGLLGRWMQEKKKKDRWDDQIILIFSGNLKSDSGPEEIDFRDLVIQTPLWIKPGAAWHAGVGCLKGSVESVDIGVTLAAAVGIRLSYRQNGISFLPGIKGGGMGREWIISELRGYTMIRTTECKAVYDPDGRICQLFDRRKDPGEFVNLAGQSGTWQLEQAMSLMLANLDDE